MKNVIILFSLLLTSTFVHAAATVGITNSSGGDNPMTSISAPRVQPLQVSQAPTVVTNGADYPDAHFHQRVVSKEIELTDTGCEATYGRHKVSFSGDLAASEPPITVTMQDVKRLAFRPTFLVLANRATGQNLLIAEITNRIGQIIQPDTVIWTNAFDPSGPMVDVEYRYSTAGALELVSNGTDCVYLQKCRCPF